MRDPNRIQKFCDRLAQAWRNVPDWRFGQLMVNALSGRRQDDRVSGEVHSQV